MPTREPKSITQTHIEVMGRDAKRRGRLEITSGNLTYYRKGAKFETLRISLQDLTNVLEKHAATESFSPVHIGEIGKSGFNLSVSDCTDGWDEFAFEDYCDVASSICLLEEGVFQIEDSLANRKKGETKTHSWTVQIPVTLVAQMLLTYIDDVLVGAKSTTRKSSRTPIPKKDMQRILTHMLKSLD